MTSLSSNIALGIDIGGTGIKGALVNIESGSLMSKRLVMDTPRPATPEAVANVVRRVREGLAFEGQTGIAYPGVILDGVVRTAANMDASWVGLTVADVFDPSKTGALAFLNDADAASLAEARFGAAQGQEGLVIVVTLGTGIGVALINDGALVRNCELGHLELDGEEAEHVAAASARERLGQSWAQWASVVSRYLQHLERLMWPRLIVLSGGITNNPEHWLHRLELNTPTVIAHHGMNAGIIGAAEAAGRREHLETYRRIAL